MKKSASLTPAFVLTAHTLLKNNPTCLCCDANRIAPMRSQWFVGEGVKERHESESIDTKICKRYIASE